MKKYFVLGFVALSLAACSSSEKKEMEDQGSNATESTMSNENSASNSDDAKDAGKEMQASKSSCTLDKDTRVIEVKKTESGGCELFYNKFGESKSVASSGFGTQYCEEVKDRIQSNLNKAGFTCQ